MPAQWKNSGGEKAGKMEGQRGKKYCEIVANIVRQAAMMSHRLLLLPHSPLPRAPVHYLPSWHQSPPCLLPFLEIVFGGKRVLKKKGNALGWMLFVFMCGEKEREQGDVGDIYGSGRTGRSSQLVAWCES